MRSVSRHAVARWRQRVDGSATPEAAEQAIIAMMARGSVSHRARRWLEGAADGQAGSRYCYWHERPGVALVLQGEVVVTVLTRALARQRRDAVMRGDPRRRRAWRPSRA